MTALRPLWARVGNVRVEKPVATLERAVKGLLFDCRMCGQCILGDTGMSCPMNCPKNLLVITVTATLAGFDQGLFRAARSLGASPTTAFRRITLPIIWPGVFSGALFAFATSFDEVVVVLFLGGVEQRTIPRQMWTDLREQLSPTILAAAVVLVLISVGMLLTLEALRRRNAKMRGLVD
ncbi:hypothetical protein B0E49_05180 [Polaromonas sp. C04]|nr:hypothetical protein B0E49_05180 [Polaromonas sp. C04]